MGQFFFYKTLCHILLGMIKIPPCSKAIRAWQVPKLCSHPLGYMNEIFLSWMLNNTELSNQS